MSRSEGVLSVQYMSMMSLGICVILRTYTIKMALISLAAVFVLLVIWVPFRHIVKFAHSLVSVFVAVFLALFIGFLTMQVTERVVPYLKDISTSLDYLYLLFLVPMMLAQSHGRKKQSKASETLIFAGFSVLMLWFGLIREIFGLRSIYSYDLEHIISFNMSMFLHPAVIAFMISVGLSVVVFFYRKYKNAYFQLTLESQSHIYKGLPRFRSKSEIYLWKGATAFIFVSVAVGFFVSGIKQSLDDIMLIQAFIPLVAVMTQGVMTALIYSFLKGVRDLFADWKIVSFVIPFQTLILLFPIYDSQLIEVQQSFQMMYIISYALFVAVGAILTIFLLLFIRAIKQKMLFGHRPNSFDGIPLFFAFTGMFLLVAYGFWPSVRHVFSTISSFGWG